MVDALLETKLLRPRPRRGTVPRRRLASLLARADEAPVTLVSAPAGFGKTTLVESWLRPGDRPVAWVSLDEGDRRLTSFMSYVLTALDRTVPGSAGAALTLWRSGQAPAETMLAGVLNELSVHDGDLTLVLDDYHLADGPEVAEVLAFVVDHLPPQLHLVLSTRSDPALPLPRLRARGELVEIRAADLRFDGDEVAAYLNDLHDLDLPAAAVAALETRTEGWVTALQLAVLSLRDRADPQRFIDRFTGDARFVVDYLVEEVLHRQPDDVRRFLLDTSVLERLTASLCDALSDQPGRGLSMLEQLERDNLFVVPLDEHRSWFRYHHLFADVLRAHLRRERPGDIPELHRRASRWFAQEGAVEAAVRHALAAGDDATAAELAEEAIPDLRRRRREDVILRWVDDLPAGVVRDRPVLAIGLVGGLMASNDFAGVEARLTDVEAMLARPASELVVVDPGELASVPARVEMYRAALALVSGDPAATISHAHRAIAAAPAGDHLSLAAASGLAGLASWATGDIVTAHESYVVCAAGLERADHIADVLGCSLTIADLELALGRLGDADRTLRRALDLARRRGSDGEVLRGTADMLVALSRVAWHRDDLPAAAELLRRADALGESAGLPQNPYRWRVAMARLRAAERDWPAALELINDAERVYVGDFSPPVHPVHATRARMLAASGDLALARSWVREHGVAAGDDLSYLREYEHVTLARILLAGQRATGETGSLHEAIVLLDRLLDGAEAGGRGGTVIEIEVLRALAHHSAGADQPALAALERAVDLAEPDGWLRFFLEPGPGMGELLGDLARRRPDSELVVRLLERRADGILPREVTREARGTLPDPLSERELDVLRLLGSDLGGPAIARELFVSLNTVRTHTRHIYTKLGVNNRRAAISRAHQLGLLTRTAR
ncbi:LuxR C-terminal-related transcriptional regulator [Ornithinimicrobium sp. F0845]|uniref:LuxR C-terminal-related transcriptional regulator n=1 Tax=Ornithinimicrobium sp. F0845 TaxID=2926412 RepID=UPI001FF6CDAC|nr:LuxR C-terminal-related transcriptional regulator [Ornithinimicrobium sp. F0845]MCK0112580.1 LuxR C-terminal-related transcriptional regulator [Ornithinimicrobium sp. F0845]